MNWALSLCARVLRKFHQHNRIPLKSLSHLAVAACILWAGVAVLQSAELRREDSLAAFVESADVIFIGELMEGSSFWSDDHRVLQSRFVFRVSRGLKGSSDDWIVLTELGGSRDGLTLTVSDGVRYSTGRSYLIFAGRDSRAGYRTMAGQRGQFSIRKGPLGRDSIRVYSNHPLSLLRADRQKSGFIDLADVERSVKTLQERIVP